MIIRRARKSDIDKIAKIYQQCFKGMQDPKVIRRWIRLKSRGFPANQYYVALLDKKVIGYILWIELGGFRKEAVIELDQIAVMPEYQGRGIGKSLILESLRKVEAGIRKRGSILKLVKVTTGTTNEAQRLYKNTLGAEAIAVIPDFFRGDEVILIARREKLESIID